MTEATSKATGKLEDGVVQLRFADEQGHVQAINAAQMADVLRGVVEFTSDMAKTGAFGDGLEPVVRVRPPKEGSFVLEFIVLAMNTDPVGTTSLLLTTGGTVVQAIRVGVKKLRGDVVTDFDYVSDDLVKLKYSSGAVEEIPTQAWKKLNAMPKKTRGQLRKIMSPLSDDVDRMEVRDGAVSDTTEEVLRTEPDVIADKAVYREAAFETDDVEDAVRTFVTEATLESIQFRPGKKWSVRTTHEGTRLASMEDEEFLRDLEHGHPLHKNDIFEMQIRETSTTTNGKTTTTWALIDVRRKKRGDDGDNADASGTPRDEAP